MNVRLFSPAIRYMTWLVIPALYISCTSMPGGGAPERKKMLDLTSGGAAGECTFSGNDLTAAPFPYTTQFANMLVNGVNTNMLSVTVPEIMYDSIAMNTLLQYKPFALAMLMQWAQQKKGILLNLARTAEANQLRIDYLLEAPGMPSIPVVLLYDASTASRAAAAVGLVRTVPGLQCKAALGYEALDNRLRLLN